MTPLPPPRWKVIERGRRLEVIDTRAAGGRAADGGAAGDGSAGGRSAPPRPTLPRRTRFDGSLGWTTHPFYDASGPRAVSLDVVGARHAKLAVAATLAVVAGTIALAGLSGAVLMGMAAAFAGSNGKQIRPWLTRRLDRIAVP